MCNLLQRCSSLAVLCLIVATQGFAQSSVIFGHPGASSSAYEIIPTRDGGFMVGGHSQDTTTGLLRYWVVKGSNHGRILWDSLYGSDDRDYLWSIQPTRDGGALLAGFTGVQFSGLESALMFKIDSVGHTVKTIDVNYARADHGHWFAERKQGGYFWAGHTDSEGDTTGEMILQKLDDGFNKVWEKTFHRNTGEHAHCGALTNDGGCVLLGHTVINGLEHFWANRIDSNGNLVWSQVFQSSSSNNDSPYGIVATKEGGFAMFGGSGNSQGTVGTMWLVVVDSAGNKIVDKHYGSGYSFAYSGIQSTDGGFVLIGYTNAATKGLYDVYVVKTDGKGIVRWQNKYGTPQYDLGYAVCQHNNQFILAGSTFNAAGNSSNLWLLYVDSLGKQAVYDTSLIKTPQLAFTIDSSSLIYNVGVDNHLHGTIENLTGDSIYVTFKRTQTVKTADFGFHTEIDGIEAIKDSSANPFGLGPHEQKMVLEHVVAYPAITDSGQLCLTIYQVGSESSRIERCVTLRPQPVNDVRSTTPTQNVLALQVYPNPSNALGGPISIGLTSSEINLDRIDIFNQMGILVRTLTAAGTGNQYTWDGKDESQVRVSSGVYMVKATTKTGTLVSRIIRE